MKQLVENGNLWKTIFVGISIVLSLSMISMWRMQVMAYQTFVSLDRYNCDIAEIKASLNDIRKDIKEIIQNQ